MKREHIIRLDWDIAGMARNVLFHFSRIIDSQDIKEGSHQFFCDGETWDFFVNENTISGDIFETHPFHKELGLIPITVTIEIKKNVSRVTSGFHEYDDENEEHPGIIIVNHVENFNLVSKEEIKKRSLSAVSHELYHSARWFIHQVAGTQDLTLLDHALNREETGARIQEAISIMPESKNPSNPGDFKPSLEDVIDYYLIRNKIKRGSAEYNELKVKMIESHMIVYRKCLGLF